MKPVYTTLMMLMACLFSYCLYGQSVKTIKQPPKINNVKVPSNATVNAKIHANSNSVFGTSKTHPKYSKKTTPKQGELKQEEVKKEVAKKEKVKKKKK